MFFLSFLYSLFFSPPETQGYGFAWVPNVAFNDVQFITVTNQSPPGLYVIVTPESINNRTGFFDDPDATVGLLYPLADNPSEAFTQAMQGVRDGEGALVTADDDLMLRLEGFLQYAHYCLTYINGTAVGLTLLNALRNGASTTHVEPTYWYNQASGMSKCFVAEMVIDKAMDISATQRAQLIQILQQTATEQGANAQGLTAFQWLANRINQMPLYSNYEQSDDYPPAFLNNNGAAVDAAGLQQWFNTGSICDFVANLGPPIHNVERLDFIKNAVVILLHAKSPAGRGGSSVINFDVRDWSQNTSGRPQWINTMADRPPAIGLAHELIHAYHNMRGDQPGREKDHFSTTLFELLCVGVGPWATYPVTENAIRQAWPPVVVWPPAGDLLNNRAFPQRTVYDPPGEGQDPEDMRLFHGVIFGAI